MQGPRNFHTWHVGCFFLVFLAFLPLYVQISERKWQKAKWERRGGLGKDHETESNPGWSTAHKTFNTNSMRGVLQTQDRLFLIWPYFRIHFSCTLLFLFQTTEILIQLISILVLHVLFFIVTKVMTLYLQTLKWYNCLLVSRCKVLFRLDLH